MADSWQFLDNSQLNMPTLIASKTYNSQLVVNNDDLWGRLLESYDETR